MQIWTFFFLTDVNNFSRSHLSNISSLSLNFILTCYWRMLSIPALLYSSSVTCLSFSSFSFVLVVVEGRKRTFPLPGPFAASSFAASDVDNDLSRTSPASGTTLTHKKVRSEQGGHVIVSVVRSKWEHLYFAVDWMLVHRIVTPLSPPQWFVHFLPG